MIHRVAEVLKDSIAPISWITTAGGLVTPLTKKVQGVDKVFPAYMTVDGYLDMSPDSKKTGVAFFEGAEPVVIASNGHAINEEAMLKLACWFNFREVSVNDTTATDMMLEVLENLPTTIKNENGIILARIDYRGADTSPDFWERYGFGGDKQFLMYPYGHFVLNCRANYWFRRSRCAVNTRIGGGVC